MLAKLCGLLGNVLQDKKVIDEPKAKVMAKAFLTKCICRFAVKRLCVCVCVCLQVCVSHTHTKHTQ